ncbi:MAG TPA: polyamine aminopropyltransferase [Usitatibacteraceae bacterium]|nr:polyamine aminopropyltransferase [Usitatibacteraceae bacterium]
MRLFEALNAGSGVYFEGERIDALQTPFQLIEVFDTPELGKLMRIDGANMTSERDEFFYHEALIHPAAIAHPAPREVLVVGGGDGGSSEEMLKYASVERLVLAELDAGVVDIARRHFQAVHRGALDDPRLSLQIGDGMAYVRATGRRFDLVVLDLTDPIGPAEALYAPPFFADCRRVLNPGGALVLHIGSAFSHPERVRATLANLRSLYSIVTPYFVHIPIYGAAWGFAVASDAIDPSALDAAAVDARLAARAIGARQLYNGAIHVAMHAIPEFARPFVS